MENNFIASTGLVQTILGESAAESEIILPDYCPPIMKIIKTEACAMIRSQSVRGDRAFIEGNVDFKIYYLAEGDEGVVSLFHQSPFSFSAEVHTQEPSQIFAQAKTTYYNTRALSPQKMFVKATVEICVSVFSASVMPCLPDSAKQGLEMKTVTADYSDVLCAEQKMLKISDELEIDKGTEFGKLMRYEVSFENGDVKILANKVIVRGDMLLRLIYMKASGEFGVYSAKIPLSQIIPTSEFSEGCVCVPSFTICDFRAQVKENADNYTVSYDAEIGVFVICFVNMHSELAADAFSQSKMITCTQKPVMMQHLCAVDEGFECELKADMGSIDKVCDADATAYVSSVLYDKEKQAAIIQGNYQVFAVYKDSNGDIMCLEKSFPFVFEKPLDCAPSSLGYEMSVNICDFSYSFNAQTLQMHIKGRYSGIICVTCEVNAITEIEELPEKKEASSQMILYYACKGDSVWDIAKRYSASPVAIIKNNNLQSESIDEDRMIYITR